MVKRVKAICNVNGIVAQSSTGLTLVRASMLLMVQGLLSEITTVIVMPMVLVMAILLSLILVENSAETALLALSTGLSVSLMGMMFMSETLMFVGLFASAIALSLTNISGACLVTLGAG